MCFWWCNSRSPVRQTHFDLRRPPALVRALLTATNKTLSLISLNGCVKVKQKSLEIYRLKKFFLQLLGIVHNKVKLALTEGITHTTNVRHYCHAPVIPQQLYIAYLSFFPISVEILVKLKRKRPISIHGSEFRFIYPRISYDFHFLVHIFHPPFGIVGPMEWRRLRSVGHRQ